MAGLYNGVQTKFMEMEKRAMFVHCLAHCFNRTLQDTVKAVPECRNALNVMKGLIHFVIDSPKRLDLFTNMEIDASTNLKPLCPTRWAVRFLAMSSVLSNYTEVKEFFLNVSRNDKSATGAKANALQRKFLHLEEASKIISTLVTSIKFMINNFESFWGEVTSECQDMDVDSPKLPRRRKVPKKYDDSINSSVETFTEVCDKYRRLYYETMDTSTSFLESQFKTQSFMSVNQTEQFLLVKYLKQENHLFDLLPELVKFIRVVLTIPVTSCTAERSFSCLRRVKTHLRSTMRQDRLNAIALLNAHIDESMKLDLAAICDEFICRNDLRRSTFAIEN
ncbi:uncharacterized protein LOC124719826 [Schistocerca piceifrons]|uniref:uncharacterized protein LOC124719826 n=1 Tax=Schistocerca piceifrons TaxID=274613 RepID=UPI001F5F828F|nr:uncharacterized protein LOC124719826 [Schistocerca piceifrons]